MAERKGKEKIVEKRKREFAAGGVVFRRVREETLWLVTKSAPSEAYPDSVWRLAKGWLDDEDDGVNPGPLTKGERKASEEELQKAALREVREEGGVEARIVGKVGTEKLFLNISRGRLLKFITFYLMRKF